MADDPSVTREVPEGGKPTEPGGLGAGGRCSHFWRREDAPLRCRAAVAADARHGLTVSIVNRS
jgi:hypothetical protein